VLPFIAIDWGTTNRRAWRIEHGAAVEGLHDAAGVLSIPPDGFPAAAAAVRDRLGQLPLLMAGMVGSNRGWIDAGYVGCPATLAMLASQAIGAADDAWILPGVSHVAGSRGDVMRGEEVQFLGAVAAGFVPPDALMCQPGTHCKWARVERGALARFTTAMTGELFGLLRDHSLVGSAMRGAVGDGTPFREGVARSIEGDLTAALFGIRAASILGLRDDADAAAYASGLLIGADCRSQVVAGATVHLLADAALGGLYRAAIETLGGSVVDVDSHAAFLAGIVRIRELMP
jgi:2-dehydro-3-deoxygalactonokinase